MQPGEARLSVCLFRLGQVSQGYGIINEKKFRKKHKGLSVFWLLTISYLQQKIIKLLLTNG